MSIRIYKPEIFQGDLKKKNYFEGWYFKHVSKDLEQVYSFIPGISLNDHDSHAFIQVINGITGETKYINYPLQEFFWDKKRFFIKVGESVFSDAYIELKIENENLNVTGHIEYGNMVKYPKSLLSPGIMGWYSFVPFMECKHGVVSVNHDLSGSLRINDTPVDFDRGKGYIEKDWGTSFPEAWLWIQANNFQNHDTSFSFSVAKIPWMGKFFIGLIAFLYFDKRFYLFSTYNNSVISGISQSGDSIKFTLNHRNNILKLITTRKTFGVLRAPDLGNMSRRIKESIDSQIEVSLFDKNSSLIYNDRSSRAGLEVTDKIFSLLTFSS